jgi:insulysin
MSNEVYKCSLLCKKFQVIRVKNLFFYLFLYLIHVIFANSIEIKRKNITSIPYDNSSFISELNITNQILKTENFTQIKNNNSHPSTFQEFTDTVIKAKNDFRKYYSLKLKNGLEIIFIRDNLTINDGASLTVKSGAAMDGEIKGLAHFTEHMLFLGSKKYPKATYFVDYITKHHGLFNGYTAINRTAYYFKIDRNYFPNAMEIFSRFFIDPLFNSTFIEKEINSVNSEYEKNLQLDSQRRDHILRRFARKGSFYSQFRTGNINTLKKYCEENKINLRNRVHEYFKKFYVPSNMKLIIYGSKSKNHYLRILKHTFSKIPAPSVSQNNFTKNFKFEKEKTTPFRKFKQGEFIFYETIKNHRELEINFLIPNVYKMIPYNPALFFKSLIEYQGKGSIIETLRSRGYLTYLKSNLKAFYPKANFFRITALLTDEGIKNIDIVLKIIQMYFDFIRDNLGLDSTKCLFKKIKIYFLNKFQNSFYKEKNVIKELSNYSTEILDYPKKYINSQHKLLHRFNKKILKKFSNFLNLKNSIILLGNKNFRDVKLNNFEIFERNEKNIVEGNFLNSFSSKYNREILLDKVEPYLFAKYTNFTLNLTTLEKIDFGNLNFRLGTNNEEKNILNNKKYKGIEINNNEKTTNFTHGKNKKQINKFEKQKLFRDDITDLTPTLLVKQDDLEVFYKLDRFNNQKHKVNIFIQFIFPFQITDPKYTTFLRLLVYSINYKMRDYFLNMNSYKNSIKIFSTSTGISIRIRSYPDQILNLIPDMLSHLKNLSLSLTEKDFKLIKEEMRNQYEGINNTLPKIKAFINLFSLVLKDNESLDDILHNLSNFSLEQFLKIYDKFFNFVDNSHYSFFTRILIHGDVEIKIVEKLIEKLKLNFLQNENNKSLKICPILKNNILYTNNHADLSGYFIYREKNKNEFNKDHSIINFYQLGEDTRSNILKASLIKEMVGNIYFTELRIKEQLGYSATGKIFSEGGLLYYMILIQGSTMTPDLMDEKIEEVINKMYKRVKNYPDGDFDKLKLTMIRKLTKKYDRFKSRSDLIWTNILDNKNFNFKLELSEESKKITKRDIIIFFDQIFNINLRKLSIQEFSNQIEKIPQGLNLNKRNGKFMNFIPKLIADGDFNYFRKRKKFYMHIFNNSNQVPTN